MLNRTTLALTLAGSLGVAAQAPAAVFIDFGAGPVEAGATQITTASPSAEVDGVTVTASGSLMADRDRAAPADSGGFTYGDLLRDLVQRVDTLTISGLDPTQIYSIQIWAHDAQFDDGFTYTFDADADDLSGSILNAHVTPGDNDDFSFKTGPFTGLSTVTYTVGAESGGQNAASHINGLYIDVVPEPASLALLGIGGLAAFTRRRA